MKRFTRVTFAISHRVSDVVIRSILGATAAFFILKYIYVHTEKERYEEN